MTGLPEETLTRAVVFAVALVALFVGHNLGDHVFQTDRQAGLKAGPGGAAWRAMAGHLLGYHVTVLAVLLLTAGVLRLPLSPLGVVAGLVFSAVTHGLLDRRWPVRAVLKATRSPQFAETQSPVCGMYVADQALHQLFLLIAALMIAAI
ncbi:DUF3307 domain-containing protein [Dactylosporangium vinaceum]|uniref:DUF3307 domain-containing protein n=1 Tax=Dactylosporangium vinaceum TaxID=53362 RepID=A0ABV5M8B9_9ACTN|nr:DUF3307 domain-containing protein [Dactylosporangium vinaceum]UAB94251.1 DUF3307 domain-containing protein [Dactylosporangium vinaceum]